MNIVILGAPGSGKGTQAPKIIESLKIGYIATGDILRQHLKDNTDIGKQAKAYIDKGQLVPDEIVISLVQEEMKKPQCENGFLLDGFPRNLKQAQELEKVTKIDKVINLDINLNKLLKRIIGRRVCPKCRKTYNIDNYKSEVCEDDGEKLIQRPDDMPKTVKTRLKVYKKNTKPLIKYYTEKNKLINIDGNQDIDKVTADILGELK